MDELQTSGKEHLRRDRLLKLMQQDSTDLELMVCTALVQARLPNRTRCGDDALSLMVLARVLVCLVLAWCRVKSCCW